MDALEKYIQQNEEQLDNVETVDADAIWNRIQQSEKKRDDLQERPISPWQIQIGRNWLWSAAAAILLAIGIFSWLYQDDKMTSSGIAPDKIVVFDYYPQIAEEEMAFQQSIAHKEAELDIDQLDRQQYIDIFAELDELEQNYRQQLQDLPEVVDNEEWVRSLMRYYERKLRVLEHLAREINKQEQLEERSQAQSI